MIGPHRRKFPPAQCGAVWFEHRVVELKEWVRQGVERPSRSDRVVVANNESRVNETAEDRINIRDGSPDFARDTARRDRAVGDRTENAVMQQSVLASQQGILGKKRGGFAAERGRGAQHPLGDPSIKI